MSYLLVSVIITTKNEQVNIQNCLESIPTSLHPSSFILPPFSVEIIVVDNNSIDKTVEIAKKYTDKVCNFGPERSAQRNFGVKKANGKYILYLDADMILSENVIFECIEKCEKEGCFALYIPERIIGEGFWVKIRDLERSFYNATVIDCVRFVRRDKFLEIGGFDESLTGPEDWDFDRRIKEIGEVDIVNAPIYHNEGEFNLRKYINKKSYYVKSFDKYIQKWGKNDKIIRKQLGFWYRYFGVFMEDGKWKRLLRHPILSGGMYGLRILVGIRYLLRIRKSQDNIVKNNRE